MRRLEEDLFGRSGNSAINSKNKGNTNERAAAEFLSKWTGEKFCRVPASGGLRWKNFSRVCGDVVCENEDFVFPFSVETKHLKDLKLSGNLTDSSKVLSIWEQCKRDAERSKKEPLLLLRKNGMMKGSFIVFVDKGLVSRNYGITPVARTVDGTRFNLFGFTSSLFLYKIKYFDLIKNL